MRLDLSVRTCLLEMVSRAPCWCESCPEHHVLLRSVPEPAVVNGKARYGL